MADNQELNYMINDLGKNNQEYFCSKVISFVKEDDFNYLFTCDNELALRVTIVTDKIIRYRYATDGNFEDDFSYAIDEKFSGSIEEIEFKEKNDHFRITTDRIIFTLAKEDLHVRILDKSGNVLSEDEKGFHWEENKKYGGNIVKVSKQIHSGEHFYGLGDKSGMLEMRGKRFELWGSDTYGYGANSDPLYKNIPFYIGLHKKTAYGIFMDNSFRSYFDFGHERSNVTSFFAQGGEMNYYFIYGPDILDVVKQYHGLTGVPELPPLWALGFQQCKWSYYPESVVKNITSEFRKQSIPCDAIYLDIDYMDGFRCFTWDKEKFPNPKKMVKELSDDGFKTVVIIDPGIKIDKEYSVYNEAFEKGYFCKRGDGPLMKGSVWPGLCNFPDFTNPEVREWWSGLFKGLIEEVGVRGVWNDMNEPAVFEDGTFPVDVRHDYDGHPCSHRKGHNVYGMQMARATNDGVKKFSGNHRPFTISRSGYAGMQRYSSGWTGDNIASWEHLIIANTQCQRLSISGLSFIGSDIGGFIETPDGELFTRWIQMGAFHPFFRVHSSGDHGDQEPWVYGDPFTGHIRKAIELRYQLLSYMYTAFYQNIKTGVPILRPIVFMDQNEPETYSRQEEFGVGDNLLVCPISTPKADGRWLFLPSGNWYYYWTDEFHAGKDEVWAQASLDRIPLFIREGAVIPHNPVVQYVGEKPTEELTLHVYNIQSNDIDSNKSLLYEDAGDGHEYHHEKGFVERTFIVSKSKEGTITLKQTKKGLFDPEYKHFKIVLHGFDNDSPTLTVGGVSVKDLNQVPKDFEEVVIS